MVIAMIVPSPRLSRRRGCGSGSSNSAMPRSRPVWLQSANSVRRLDGLFSWIDSLPLTLTCAVNSAAAAAVSPSQETSSAG